MKYTELELFNLYVNNDKISYEYIITDHGLCDFFYGHTDEVPKEYKDIERELEKTKNRYGRMATIYRHSYLVYIAAVIKAIKNDGLEITDEFFNFTVDHWTFFSVLESFIDGLVMLYLPHRKDLLYRNHTNYTMKKGPLYQIIGGYLIRFVKGEIYNKNEKDFFDLLESYKESSNYVRNVLTGFYYFNYKECNLSIETLKDTLNRIPEIQSYMRLNGINNENIDENVLLGFFNNKVNKIPIK